MNAPLLCLVALLANTPASDDWNTIYRPSNELAAVFRGQNPTFQYEETPPLVTPGLSGQSGPMYSAPPASGGPASSQPFSTYQPAPLNYDPFLGTPSGVAPYGGPAPGMFAFGANGPQPYAFGWTSRYDLGILPKEPTDRYGNFGIFEFDSEWEYTTATPWGWIFSFTQQYGLRTWDGPHSSGTNFGLPGDVHRIGWDFEASTPANGPWSFQLAFNPSINSDFERHLTSDAWNMDGRGIAFYRVSPHWMLALGAGFWDRVNDRVIPYAGAIWTPDDRWEYRLVFPQPRISYFLGKPWGVDTWVYVSGEYHVEAYEIEVDRSLRQEKIEIEDWRVVLGLRQSNGFVSAFVEAGWVFGREVDFIGVTPGFDISSGFIARAGLAF